MAATHEVRFQLAEKLQYRFPNKHFSVQIINADQLAIFYDAYSNESDTKKIVEYVKKWIEKWHPEQKYKLERMKF